MNKSTDEHLSSWSVPDPGYEMTNEMTHYGARNK